MAHKAVPGSSTKIVPTDADPALPGPSTGVVFVVDNQGRPLMPCSPRKARILLNKKKRADVFCAHPFTIRIRDRESGDVQPTQLKVDPGSKTTGLALMVKGAKRGWMCVCAWELSHRGAAIHKAMVARAALRRGRRTRKTRYRPARFLNRTKPTGWLPPSLKSRVDNVLTFAGRLQRICSLSGLAVEAVRFDLQKMMDPEISGTQYQQGTLLGYEVREYLLLKWNHRCAYCEARNVRLEVEHMVSLARGGSDRVSNLCLACRPCNQKKGSQPLETFLKDRPALLKKLLAQARSPLKDATAVNTTRKTLVLALGSLCLPISEGSGGLTKFNRTRQAYPKAHWVDAACVGATGSSVSLSRVRHITLIQAKGRGDRQMCGSDKHGFPRTVAKSVKRFAGFQTGDRVRLVQPTGKYKGTHEGAVSIRVTGQFDLKKSNLKITAPHHRFTRLSRFDGYTYAHQKAALPQAG